MHSPETSLEADRDERFGADGMDGECCALLRRKHTGSGAEARPLRRRRR